MNIFLAPHSDDEALFGSYIIQRTQPLVVICTDGAKHQEQFNIPVQQRRDESILGCFWLGVDVHKVKFLGLPDSNLEEEKLLLAFKALKDSYKGMTGIVFAPTITGGQPQHDMVSRVATQVWQDKVIYYGTYSRESFSPNGEMPINPTSAEIEIKNKALACYKSQLGINQPHFDAVKDKPEYISFKP